MVKAMVMMKAQPAMRAVTSDDTIAKGTALAAFDASSAIVADDSKPETTQTGVRNESINAQPLLGQKPVFEKSEKTKLPEFLNSEGVAAARAMSRAIKTIDCSQMYA
jgi:hypothetical protein